MSALDRLEGELIAAVRRRAVTAAPASPAESLPSLRDGVRRGRWRRGSLLVPAILLGLVGLAIASTQILFGSRAPRGPQAGHFKVAPKTAVLLPLRVADPDGGPPWALREFVKTSVSGRQPLTCLQPGQLYRGKLGVVGRQGAFSNDGRFHVLNIDPGGCWGGRASSLAGPRFANAVIGPTRLPGLRGSALYGETGPHSVAVEARIGKVHRRATVSSTAHHAFFLILPPHARGQLLLVYTLRNGRQCAGVSARCIAPDSARRLLAARERGRPGSHR